MACSYANPSVTLCEGDVPGASFVRLLSDETAKTIISAVTLTGSVEQCYK